MTRVLCIVITIAVWAAPARAQTPLPLPQAIDEAIAHNPSLAAARAATRQADAERRMARAAWTPQITYAEAWQRSTQPVMGFGALLNGRLFTAGDFAVDRLNRPGETDAFVRRLSVQQLLFDANHASSALAMATRRREMADDRTAAAVATLAWQITEAYAQVLAAQAAVTSATSATAWADEDLARATARRDAGRATDGDVLAMQVQLAEMRQRAAQATAELAIARAHVNQLAGAAIDRAFTALPPTVETSAGDLSTLLATARALRPELHEAAHAVELATAAVRDARGSWLPTVAAAANYEWNGLTFGTRASAWTVGAELRWTISTGGAEVARVAAAQASLDAATANRRAAESGVEFEVLSARERWLAARASVTTGRASVEDANESLRITRERYAAGLASVRDVLAATAAALAAEARRVSTDLASLTAWAALERAVGRAPFVPRS